VVKAGYNAAFLTLGTIAAIGFAVCWFAQPETCAHSDVGAGRMTHKAPSVSGIAAG
jgi:hypothetical protein